MSIPQTSITVSIGDTRLPSLKSLRLDQGIGCHHRFDLCIDLEAGSNRYVHNIGSSSEWLGQPITVHSSDQPIFLGVVTNVRLHREGSDFGFILISGYSATYRMETAPGCFSWLDQPIGDVVRSLCGQANVQLKLNPAYGKKLDYICQYDESDFDFVRRLALQYQEWMYYDGTSLVFGRPKDSSEPVELEYGTTLSSLEIGLQTLARPEQVFTYHSSSDREMDQPTPDLAYGHDQLSGKAFRASLGMYGRPARQHALPRIHTESELIKYMRRKQAADTAETHYVTAESHVPELRVGSIVRLYSSFLERVGQLTRESLGDFIITEIVHEVGEGSYYRNRFKAIPSTVEALPSPRVPMPVAETQMATVTSNADPNGNGRVQVRMNWQQGDMHTGWVRVMTPDAGKSGDVSSNRGFVFIPEVGDQVLLGFRHGDPARPYVMGSLFNGSTGGGGGQGNSCKSLTTRSGSSLKLDDSKGSVTLADPGKTSIFMDGSGNATFDSSEKILISCGSASIELHQDGTIKINGKDISVDGEKIKVDGKESIKQTTKDYSTTGTQSVKVDSNALITQKAKKVDIDAGNTVSIKGAIAANIESVTTNVKGSGSVNLN
ncbi:type IV secretion protein Rhs [Prevotella intermedia]|uniref:Type IV secretion protein Rhs n=1 Tax=Prevotella intermedia TaxID=28131 RepID=A0A2G9ICM3_PREIN|nr:phage baseplate assembly protein V [Prevotella intermedia]PIN27517.1 type IV secretion protein Rhs [Prevotella intermedia]